MTTRALVLSGGGPVGIAWESGLIGGLALGGIDVSKSDFIMGTSAGSFVGSLLARGTTPAEVAAPFLAMDEAAPPRLPASEPAKPAAPPSTSTLWLRMERGLKAGKSPEDIRADIGAFALEAQTVSEEDFIKSFGRAFAALPDDFWPDANYACTAVDALTGAFKLWTKDSGVGLARAVASSCSVPGIFPPVTLQGRRYIDGGMRSGGNADYAVGYDRVLLVAIRVAMDGPMAERTKRSLDAELKVLTDAGAEVEVVYPDADSIAAFGPNLMDASRRPTAAKAGYAQGQVQAGALKDFWEG